MLTLPEKLQTAPALLPMLVEGQKFIDLQDELSVRPLKGCTGKSWHFLWGGQKKTSKKNKVWHEYTLDTICHIFPFGIWHSCCRVFSVIRRFPRGSHQAETCFHMGKRHQVIFFLPFDGMVFTLRFWDFWGFLNKEFARSVSNIFVLIFITTWRRFPFLTCNMFLYKSNFC